MILEIKELSVKDMGFFELQLNFTQMRNSKED